MTDKTGPALLVAVNALQHMIEHHDTHEATDVHAAFSLMANSSAFKEWLSENEILIPLRRDGRSLLERIEDYR